MPGPRNLPLVASLCALVLTSASLPFAANAAVGDLADVRISELLETYRQLHAHPELSYQEENTSGLLAARMRSLGFEVTERFGRYTEPGRTSFGLVAVLENGTGPTLLIRTDLDGLPVEERTGLEYASRARARDDQGNDVAAMHACGHDLHMTVWLGTATLLAEHRDRWRGTLVMIGQPAEERGAGARAMLDAGLYEKFGRPDYALALHANAALPAGSVGLRSGYALANVDSVDVKILGVGGHGAYPHTTIDPIVIAAQVVVGLQTIVSRKIPPLDPSVITVGSIHGGTKHNVIPDEVDLQLTVRSYKPEVRAALLEGIRRTAREIARAGGVPDERLPVVTVHEEEFTPATFNDPGLTSRLETIFSAALGPENVIAVDPVMGGEDFGRFTLEDRSVPLTLFWLGAVDPAAHEEARRTGQPLPSLHSPLFAPLPAPAIRTGVTAMTAAALELMAR